MIRFTIAILIALTVAGCRLSIGGVEAPINDPIPDYQLSSMWGEGWENKSIKMLRRHCIERNNKIDVFRNGTWRTLRRSDRDPLGETIRVARRSIHLTFKVNNSGRLKYVRSNP